MAAANGPIPWRVIATVAGLVAYLGAFYWIDYRRRLCVALLLVPDSLVHDWVENDWSRLGVLDHVPVLAGAALLCVVAGLTGWLFLNALRIDEVLQWWEQMVVSIAAGLNVWSLVTLAVGLAGRLQNRWLFAVLATTVALIALFRMWHVSRSRRNSVKYEPTEDQPNPPPLTWFGRLPLLLCVPLTVVILLGGTLPATHFDVREYHLQVPKEWFQQGRVTFLSHNVYGNMPLGAELYSILGMLLCQGKDDWWWGALIGKTVIAAFAPLAAAGVYLVGRRFLSSDAGAWGAFAYLSTPWIGHVSMTGLIDGVVACYVVLAVAMALLGFNGTSRRAVDGINYRWRLMALSGFLAGSAVACKYPALVFLAIPLGLLVTFVPTWKIHWKSATAFSLAMILACGLWFGKNWVLAGNPTYPLLFGVFGGKSWNAEKDARWTRAHGPPHDAKERQFSAAQVWESLSVLAIKSDQQSPWLIPLALAALWAWPISKQRWLLAILYGLVGCSVLSWWLLTHRIDRFLVPMIPLVAVAAGIGATWSNHTLWKRAIMILGIWCGVASFLHISSGYVADNRILTSLADLRADVPRTPLDPRAKSRTRMNSGHRWLNENVPAGHRVLLVGEAQVFDLEPPILYNTCFDDCVLETLLRGRTREERRRILQEQRISHIFVSWYELERYRAPGNYGYSDFPTRGLFYEELTRQQGLLRPVRLSGDPTVFEIFEVIAADD